VRLSRVEPESAERLPGAGPEQVRLFEGGTYRAVYTVRFAEAVYVLHAFQKKSTSGIATPKHELDLVRARLREAEAIVKRISSRGPT